jgi:excisionase family DNA binding protein
MENLHEAPISLAEARKFLLNVSRTTLRKWISEGKITAHKNGKRLFFFQSELSNNLKSLPNGRN